MAAREDQMSQFETAIRETVARHGLFRGAARAVVAVSGGPDSMALLYALVRLRRTRDGWPELAVAHLDHGLRGAESSEDAEFVRRTAAALDLPVRIERAEVGAEAARLRRNVEAVARDIRYEFLARAADELGADVVATGHTATDQAETVLLRIARGAGTDGLAGIAPKRPLAGRVALVRPMLGVSKEDALAYCREREISHRTDATNEDTALRRVFARYELLPRLERLSPGAVPNIARAALLAADDRAYFAARVAELFEAWGVAASPPVAIPAAETATLPAALRRRVLREAYARARGDLKRLTFEHVEALERLLEPGRGGRQVALPYGVRARRSGGAVVLDATVEI